MTGQPQEKWMGEIFHVSTTFPMLHVTYVIMRTNINLFRNNHHEKPNLHPILNVLIITYVIDLRLKTAPSWPITTVTGRCRWPAASGMRNIINIKEISQPNAISPPPELEETLMRVVSPANRHVVDDVRGVELGITPCFPRGLLFHFLCPCFSHDWETSQQNFPHCPKLTRNAENRDCDYARHAIRWLSLYLGGV